MSKGNVPPGDERRPRGEVTGTGRDPDGQAGEQPRSAEGRHGRQGSLRTCAYCAMPMARHCESPRCRWVACRCGAILDPVRDRWIAGRPRAG